MYFTVLRPSPGEGGIWNCIPWKKWKNSFEHFYVSRSLIYLNWNIGWDNYRKLCSDREKSYKDKQHPAKFIKGFAAVTSVPTEDLEILFGDLQKLLKDMAEIESDVEILPPPNDVTHKMKKKRSVIFKTFCPEEKKIIHIDHKIEKRLAPIWNDIEKLAL